MGVVCDVAVKTSLVCVLLTASQVTDAVFQAAAAAIVQYRIIAGEEKAAVLDDGAAGASLRILW